MRSPNRLAHNKDQNLRVIRILIIRTTQDHSLVVKLLKDTLVVILELLQEFRIWDVIEVMINYRVDKINWVVLARGGLSRTLGGLAGPGESFVTWVF